MQSHAERETLLAALKETGFNKVHAARLLGIHRTLLYKKMRKYNLPLKAL
jgi:transcriptional regulator of acetoin/glycerol metabolism